MQLAFPCWQQVYHTCMDINVLFTDGIIDINNIAIVSLLSIKAYNTLIKLVLTRGIMFPPTYLDNNVSCSSSHFSKKSSRVIWFDFDPGLPIKGFTFSNGVRKNLDGRQIASKTEMRSAYNEEEDC